MTYDHAFAEGLSRPAPGADLPEHPERLWRNPEPRRNYDVVIVGGGGHGCIERGSAGDGASDLEWVALFALAVNEENAAGGLKVNVIEC